MTLAKKKPRDIEAPDAEAHEWLESLEAVQREEGRERAAYLLRLLEEDAREEGLSLPPRLKPLYLNTIPARNQPAYPGNLTVEKRLTGLMRWNAMAMVVRANREESGIGGHISTYASCANLYEVAFHHFLRGKEHECGGDHVYFQGHASPGNYARAYLEGRLSEENLRNFRREVRSSAGLSSYPHPWLMPDFWEFPTVSMGLSPIQAIYRARFIRYLENRGLKKPSGEKIWSFVGDGETDEPEALGAITLAAREKLDNLIFVINCNLQRLDGPVRGNGKIIEELETVFGGVGWNVLKVIWGSEWDTFFAQDEEGALARRLTELLDGQYQKCYVEGGSCIRREIFGGEPLLEAMVKNMSDEELTRLRVGGHDPVKIHAAYQAAMDHVGGPSVILAKTVKGYGLGEAGEGRNITHQQKKLNEQELKRFRDRFEIPVPDAELADVPFYRPPENSEETRYLLERRRALGGFVPKRTTGLSPGYPSPDRELFEDFLAGSDHPLATTMILVHLLSRLLRDPALGRWIVPIVPDEARTFGMDGLFRQCGIYSSIGQLYEPVDIANIMYYREAEDGQLLEEGITEAGSMSSFIAAGTAYAAHRVPTIPFFFFYSMFGFQRIGDLIWSAGDNRARGFMVGGTAGRTTLAGEGLQHQDGHSHLIAQAHPNVRAYDAAYAYELAVIVEEGLRRIQAQEDVIYYLTGYNEAYAQPSMPPGVREGILQGIYRVHRARESQGPRVDLMGSGPILQESLKAQKILEEKYGVFADVWSVTSYQQLRREALEVERWNWQHPDRPQRVPYLTQVMEQSSEVFVAASDYLKALPDCIAKWLPGRLISLGTDGFGRSDSREDLRSFFEVDARHIAFAALSALSRRNENLVETARRAARELEIGLDKPDPMYA